MEVYLKDVNLSEINILDNGRNITLKFTDMSSGQKCVVIQCTSVNLFNYHNTFDIVDDGLPCYVGEVKHGEFCNGALSEKLEELNYGFKVDYNPIRPDPAKSKPYISSTCKAHVLHLEGEIIIDLVCSDITFT